MYASGKVHEGSNLFSSLKKELSIKDKRTFDKHFTPLLELDWIGYNKKSGYFFIRSLSRIYTKEGFRKSQACLFSKGDLQNIQVYAAGAIISDNIRKQKYHWEFQKKKNLSVSIKKENANQIGFFSGPPSYYGLSNKRIAALLCCKQTRGHVLKVSAAKAGYIKTVSRFKDIVTFKKPDFFLRYNYENLSQWYTGKLRIQK
jgi:hypothetical protein